MADERQKEIIWTYEAYLNRYGKEDVEIMLQEFDYKNWEDILNVVRVFPSRKQNLSGKVDIQGSKKRRSVDRKFCSKLWIYRNKRDQREVKVDWVVMEEEIVTVPELRR